MQLVLLFLNQFESLVCVYDYLSPVSTFIKRHLDWEISFCVKRIFYGNILLHSRFCCIFEKHIEEFCKTFINNGVSHLHICMLVAAQKGAILVWAQLFKTNDVVS